MAPSFDVERALLRTEIIAETRAVRLNPQSAVRTTSDRNCAGVDHSEPVIADVSRGDDDGLFVSERTAPAGVRGNTRVLGHEDFASARERNVAIDSKPP